jgi:hypothetical protein
MGGRHKSDPSGNGRAVYALIALVAIMLVGVAVLALTSVI